MKHIALALALALPLGSVASAVAAQDTASTQASLPWVDAQVKKVDTGRGRLTLRHGDIPNLDMPGMTMVFHVADPKMLEGVKPGDAIRIAVDKVKGRLTVVRLQPAQ
ncbi:MAG: RND transporter [Betaproteobacteria bacterium]|nr:RND transporter [Betaproteobacteria bacterium]